MLHETYRKFPTLYNSSMVTSFEPKVIYKVRECRTEHDLLDHLLLTDPALPSASQVRQTDPSVVTALKHRPWRLSRFSDGTPRTLSPWAQMWTAVLDVLLDWAHHHLLWRLCGVSALFVQKDFVSP